MLNRLKEKLVQSVKSRKLNVFGLFFLLALLFWALTKLSKVYTETIPFEIVYKNVPEHHHVEIDSSDKVQVTVNSYGFNLLPYFFYKPKLNIDFKLDVVRKNKNYVWNAQQNAPQIIAEFKNSVDVISINPDTLRFPFQSLTVKKVPVILDISLHFASGYDMSSKLKVIPDSIKIIGSEKKLSKISAVTTKALELKQLNSNIDKTVALELNDMLGQLKLSHKSIRIKGDVEKFTEGTFEVPVSIINLPANTKINYFPKTVPLVYNVSLNNYKLVKASDFRLECNYNEIKNTDKTFLTPKLVKSPEIVKSVRIKQKKIEFILMQ